MATQKQLESARKNLRTPWKKGQSGNPSGRRKNELSITHLRNSVLAQKLKDEQFIETYFKEFLKQAERPASWQAKLVADRLFTPDILHQLDAVLARKDREDTDFRSFRIWRRAHAIQRAFIWSPQQEVQLMAGRRAGKTEGFGLTIGETIVRRQEARCLYIGKTITRAMDVLWKPVRELVTELGFRVKEHSRVEGRLELDNGAEIHFGGNSNAEEREKHRGQKWDLVIVDECQSQAKLDYLVEDIVYPMLIDRKGRLMLGGTGPRVRGTHWDYRWSTPEKFRALRLNFSIADNPYIPDYATELERIRAEKGLSETSPLFVREYLGRISYDDDALVLRLGPANWYTDEDLAKWIAGQAVTDIRFEAGLDVGFEDADGFAVICYSLTRPERWLVYEYKARRTGTEELLGEVQKGIEYVKTSPIFAKVERKKFLIYTDTGGLGKKVGYDLSLKGLPIQDAYKADKSMAIEMLQNEVRTGMFKVHQGGPFADESLKTVFARNERDELTREIDDEAYHPDLMDAVTYGMRPIWMFARKGG